MEFCPQMSRPLAILGSISLLLCAVAAVQASPKEKGQKADAKGDALPDNRTMLDRFTADPNYDLTYKDPSIKSYGATKSVTGPKNADVKAFNLLSGFHTKDYSAGSYKTEASGRAISIQDRQPRLTGCSPASSTHSRPRLRIPRPPAKGAILSRRIRICL